MSIQTQKNGESNDNDYETIDNPERGCGYLKPGKAYFRTDVGPGGSIPSFVEFAEPIPFKEDRKRSYKRFPGMQFELSVTGEGGFTHTIPSGEIDRHIERLKMDRPTGSHCGEMVSFEAHDYLMSVGKSHYPTAEEFVAEARIHGVSKAISVTSGNEPPEVNPGRTRLFLIHPRACETEVEVEKTWKEYSAEADELIDVDHDTVSVEDVEEGRADLDDDVVVTVRKTVRTPGVFGYTYLSRVVYTVDEDGKVPEYVQEYEDTGDLSIVKPGKPVPYSQQDYFTDEGELTDDVRTLLAQQDLIDAETYDYERALIGDLHEAKDEIEEATEEIIIPDPDDLDRAVTGDLADEGWLEAVAPPEEMDRLRTEDADVLALIEAEDGWKRIDASVNFNVKKSPEDGFPFTEGQGVLGPYKITVRDDGDRQVRVERTR